MKKRLFQDFEKSDKKEWTAKATSDLKGEDPYDKYNWSYDNLTLQPYYDQSDTVPINHEILTNRLFEADDPSGDPRVWRNIQRIEVDKESEANSLALEALLNGADGVEFDLQNKTDLAIEKLLTGIKHEYCHLSFINCTKSVVVDLYKHFGQVALLEVIISGGLEPEEVADLLKRNSLKNVIIKAIEVNKEADPSTEIGALLFEANTYIRSLLLRGISIEQAFDSLSIATKVGTHYFGEIAKIRAIRHLFFQLAHAYGYTAYLPENLHIKSISTPWANEAYQPHANMLKASTAAMAAILGGCNSLVTLPEDKGSKMQTRIARNVSSIIKEESYFAKVADPVAGSYYLEALTDELAKLAWQKFQIEMEGVEA